MLRKEAGLSGNRLAKNIGWPQSKVSKIETAKQLPTEADIQRWVDATSASEATMEELLSSLQQARVEYATWKDHFRAVGAAGLQADIGELENRSTRIGEFQPVLIPGLVQTAQYALDLLHLPPGPLEQGLSEADIDQMVAARIQRQEVLHRPDKHVQLVVLQGALLTRVGPPKTLAGQLNRLIRTIRADLETLEFGIIPFESRLPVTPVNSFAIYDGDMVVIEDISGQRQLSDPDEVLQCDRIFDALRGTARYGEEAIAIIETALADITRGAN